MFFGEFSLDPEIDCFDDGFVAVYGAIYRSGSWKLLFSDSNFCTFSGSVLWQESGQVPPAEIFTILLKG